MMTMRFLAPALVGAALLGPASGLAQTMAYPQGAPIPVPMEGLPSPAATLPPVSGAPAMLPPGHPAVAPMAVQPMPAAPMMDGRANVSPTGGVYEPSMAERQSWEELREQERRAWERERQQLIRQGHGVPSTGR